MGSDPYNAAVDELSQIGIGLIEVGVPPPKRGGFITELRGILGRMAVHDSIELKNVSRTKEKQVRVRITEQARKLKRGFSVRAEKRPKGDTHSRTLRVWRIR
jgi:C4-type Zn-finger protein